MFTTLNQYHVVLEVEPQFQYGPEALNDLYVSSSTGQQVPLRTLVETVSRVAPIVVNHQGQFPSVTLSFNLPAGVSIGEAVSAIHQLEPQPCTPPSLPPSSQRHPQPFISSPS